MIRLAEIETRIASMGELLEIVGAMRSLASMRMQEAQRNLPGIRRYAASVAAGIGDALRLVDDAGPPPAESRGRTALVLCMAEHRENRRRDKSLLFCLGSRGAALAAERGLVATFVHPMATRSGAAPGVVQALQDPLYRRIAAREVTRVDVIFAATRERRTPSIEHHTILPLEPAAYAAPKPGSPPLHNLPPALLHEHLIGEYVIARLTEAVVESVASENAARLAAMDSAQDNASKKLEGLRRDAAQARQQEITAEILDLVTAATALAHRKS